MYKKIKINKNKIKINKIFSYLQKKKYVIYYYIS